MLNIVQFGNVPGVFLALLKDAFDFSFIRNSAWTVPVLDKVLLERSWSWNYILIVLAQVVFLVERTLLNHPLFLDKVVNVLLHTFFRCFFSSVRVLLNHLSIVGISLDTVP